MNVADFGSAQTAIQRGVERFGIIDVISNYAGRGIIGSVENLRTEDFLEQLTTNFMGGGAHQ